MKIVQRVQEIWSEHENVTDGMMDGRTNGRTNVLHLDTYWVLTVLEKIAKKCKYPTNPSKCYGVNLILSLLAPFICK